MSVPQNSGTHIVFSFGTVIAALSEITSSIWIQRGLCQIVAGIIPLMFDK